MPVATSTQFTRVDEMVQYWKDAFDTIIADPDPDVNLGLQKAFTYDEILIRDYPCLLLNPAPEQKDIHATHTFLFTWYLYVYVFHADLAADRMMRNKADVLLAEKITDFMEADYTIGDRVIFGYIQSKIPGSMPPQVMNRNSAVVCTRLTWFATSEGRF